MPKGSFEIFKREVVRVCQKCHFGGWRLSVEENDDGLAELSHGQGWIACCRTFPEQREISFIFSPRRAAEEGLTRAEIIEVARHEFVHALLAPIETAAQDRFVTQQELERAGHETLERIMPLLRAYLGGK